MHRSDAAQGVEVVHHREHTFLHFTTIPGIEDNLFFGGKVEDNSRFGVQSEFFVIFDFRFGSVVNNEIGFEIFQLFFSKDG